MKITTRQIVITAALSAVAILLGATRLGFIPFVLGIAITIMHIPVIIGAVLEGPIVGTVIGFLFGLFSLIWAYVAPTGAGDVYFQNPLISVLPRLFIGLFAYLVYRLVRQPRVGIPVLVLGVIVAVAVLAPVLAYATPILGEDAGPKLLVLLCSTVLAVLALAGLGIVLWRRSELVAVGAAAVVGTLTNTVLVLTALGLLSTLNWVAPPLPWSLLLAVGLTNGIPEIVAAVVITVAVVAAWKQIEFGVRGARILRGG